MRLRGWRIAPEHFAERHGLVVLIALGESIIAIGVGAGFELGAGVLTAAGLGVVVVSALWWLYFDVAAIFVRRRLTEASGVEQAQLARDSYSYLHLPMVAGIVFFAFGLETTMHRVGEVLSSAPRSSDTRRSDTAHTASRCAIRSSRAESRRGLRYSSDRVESDVRDYRFVSFLDRIRKWWTKDDVERADEETRMTPAERDDAEEDYQARRDDVAVSERFGPEPDFEGDSEPPRQP